MLRVTVDTNVLVSGSLVAEGASARIILAVEQHRFVPVMCQAILEEYVNVMVRPHITRKYPQATHVTQATARLLQQDALWVQSLPDLHCIADDPDDDVILAVALAGQAAYIVSGDPHLTKLGRFQGITILPPRDFVVQVLKEPVP